MFPLFFDPIALGLYFLGYFVMIALATAIAPRIAPKLSGKLTLFGSMALVAIMVVLTTVVVVYLIAYAIAINYGTFLSWGFLLGLIVFVIVANLLTYLASPYMINTFYGARPDPNLQRIVDDVAAKLGMRGRIKAVVVDGPPNAFAYGNPIAGRYVAVTRGMLALTDRDELEAVIGHELGHHLHRDNAIMAFLGILPSVIYYFGVIAAHLGMGGGNERGGSAYLFVLGIAAVVISFVIQLLILAFSRLREYYADMVGAKAAGREAMQAALAKIHVYYRRVPEAREVVDSSKLKALFIYALVDAVANPFITITRSDIERIKRAEYSPLEEVLATHPPIPKRLKFLDQL